MAAGVVRKFGKGQGRAGSSYNETRASSRLQTIDGSYKHECDHGLAMPLCSQHIIVILNPVGDGTSATRIGNITDLPQLFIRGSSGS